MSPKQTSSPRSKSLNDVRAPLMMLYVLAFIAANTRELPTWVGLLLASALIAPIGYYYERRTISQALRWDLRSTLFGVSLALVLYVLFSTSMQLLTTALFESGALLGDGAVPLPLKLLVEIRSHIEQVGPALTGLGGAVLVAPAEEIFWRGFIQHRLVLRIGPVWGIGLCAVLFGLFYGLLVNPLAGLAALIAGIAFSILTARAQGLLPAIASHGVLWLLGTWLLPLY